MTWMKVGFLAGFAALVCFAAALSVGVSGRTAAEVTVTKSAAAAGERLVFRSDGTFKIMQFTDLHFYQILTDIETEVNQRQLLKAEKPDLVVLTGDVVSGSSISHADHFRKEWNKSVAALEEHNTRWAMTIGNHDPDGPVTRAEIMAMDMEHPLSLSRSDYSSTVGGMSNYHLPIYASSAGAEEPVAMLWMFDITVGGCEGHAGDDCISSDVVQWYRNESAAITAARGGKPLPSFMFVHVPPPEFVDVWNYESCLGVKGENVCCPTFNTGIFQAMVDMGDALVMFVGHDHKNDYCGAFKAHPNLTLCYGRKTGYGYYNPPKHGGRVIELSLSETGDVAWKSWIRDSDGKIVDQEWHTPTGPGQPSCGSSKQKRQL